MVIYCSNGLMNFLKNSKVNFGRQSTSFNFPFLESKFLCHRETNNCKLYISLFALASVCVCDVQ